MSKAPHVLVIVILSSFLISPVLARPVTSADLYNKKICWNNGNVQTYHSGQKFEETYGGAGTWSIGIAGVIEWHTQKWSDSYRADIANDGTFNITNGTYVFTGHYCK